MLSVEITPPDGTKWRDHLGFPIGSLVFSRASRQPYVPGSGVYPLESAGGLYRNIDDFRSSPLQSLTDWEIRVPSVCSSPDGSFQTVDILHWIESVNAENKVDFSIVGCKAVLRGDSGVIYEGMAESVACGAGTAAIRVSDRLGNPRSGKSAFPIVIGSADSGACPVLVTDEKDGIRIEISSAPLKGKPVLFVRNPEGAYLEVKGVAGGFRMDYEPDWMSARITPIITAENPVVFRLTDTVGALDDLILRGNPEEIMEKLRTEGADEPDYYVLSSVYSETPDEVVEAWSRHHYDSSSYSLGREYNTSLQYENTPILRIRDMREAMLKVVADAWATSIVADEYRYQGLSTQRYHFNIWQRGNPSRLVHNSYKLREAGFDFSESAGSGEEPEITIDFGRATDLISGGIEFSVNLSSPGAPSGAAIDGEGISRIYLALTCDLPNGISEFSFRAGDSESVSLPLKMDGKVREFPVKIPGGSHLRLDFTLSIKNGWNLKVPVKVHYARAVYALKLPVLGSKIYARGEIHGGAGSASPGEGTGVLPAIRGLLAATGAAGVGAEGDSNGFEYGAALSGDAFALRDKLRTLAAESATLIAFNPATGGIETKDMRMQHDRLGDIHIPLSAFARDGGIYSFRMESADRSELAGSLSVLWGRDPETKEYAHEFSATPDGLFRDGVPYYPPRFGAVVKSEKWQQVLLQMSKNRLTGAGTARTAETEWVRDWDGAENMAYNMLRWNTAPMRKAQARCIFTELGKLDGIVDIGALVSFDLPGYHQKFRETAWIVTGRHDDLDSMVSTLELLEAAYVSAVPPEGFLLLEGGGYILLEDEGKIKLEGFHV